MKHLIDLLQYRDPLTHVDFNTLDIHKNKKFQTGVENTLSMVFKHNDYYLLNYQQLQYLIYNSNKKNILETSPNILHIYCVNNQRKNLNLKEKESTYLINNFLLSTEDTEKYKFFPFLWYVLNNYDNQQLKINKKSFQQIINSCNPTQLYNGASILSSISKASNLLSHRQLAKLYNSIFCPRNKNLDHFFNELHFHTKLWPEIWSSIKNKEQLLSFMKNSNMKEVCDYFLKQDITIIYEEKEKIDKTIVNTVKNDNNYFKL